MKGCCRKMDDDELLYPFVTYILQIDDIDKKRAAINSIIAAEGMLEKYSKAQTFGSKKYRDFQYADDESRHRLHVQIISELINCERVENDDDITLGIGGAKPRGVYPKNNKHIYYVIGLPASGKSSIANKIADATGSYILDSDMAKRKLPEFRNKSAGATLVHDESDEIIFSLNYLGKNINLFNYCVESGYNIVVPKIGYDLNGILRFVGILRSKWGYKPYLVLVDLERMQATQRAFSRFSSTNRYVPLANIYDLYGNDPILNYYRIRQKHSNCFEGYLQIDTNVKLGENPIVVEKAGISSIQF